MECKESGKQLKQITGNHLAKCCGLTAQEYKDAHCVSLTRDWTGTNNPNWKGGERFCKCGNKLARGTKGDDCYRCINKRGTKNGFWGIKHTDETRRKMSEAWTGTDRKPHGKPHTEEAKMKMSQSQRDWWAAQTKEYKREHIRKFIEAGAKAPPARTKIEILVEGMIPEGMEIKSDYRIGNYRVDFLVGENKIIEVYGDYWHCNPEMFDKDYYHKQLKMTAKEKWGKDRIRLEKLEEMCYTICIVWGTEVRNGTAEQKIKNFL